MIERGIGETYGRRMAGVWQRIGTVVAAFILVVAFGNVVMARQYTEPDAWNEFKFRCLDPLSDNGESDFAGLKSKQAQFYRPAWYEIRLYNQVAYRIGDDLEMSVLSNPTKTSQACIIATPNAEIALASLLAADKWQAEEIRMARWRWGSSLLSGPMLERAWDLPIHLRFSMASQNGTLVFAIHRSRKVP